MEIKLLFLIFCAANLVLITNGLLSNLLKACAWNLVTNKFHEDLDIANGIIETHQYLQPWTISVTGLYFPNATIEFFEICAINLLIEPITLEFILIHVGLIKILS